jgi:hypothetical protein
VAKRRLCTSYVPVPRVSSAGTSGGGAADLVPGGRATKTNRSSPEDYIHIFVNQIDKLREFLEHMVTVQPDSGQCSQHVSSVDYFHLISLIV